MATKGRGGVKNTLKFDHVVYGWPLKYLHIQKTESRLLYTYLKIKMNMVQCTYSILEFWLEISRLEKYHLFKTTILKRNLLIFPSYFEITFGKKRCLSLYPIIWQKNVLNSLFGHKFINIISFVFSACIWNVLVSILRPRPQNNALFIG